MIEMKIDNSNNSIPEIHAAADELAMGICLCQQQKATSFTLNQNRSPTRPARAPGTRQRPGLSLVLDAGYRDVGTGNLGGKDCPDTATPTPAHPAGTTVSSTHSYLQESDQQPGSSPQDIAFIASVCCCWRWCWQVTAHL